MVRALPSHPDPLDYTDLAGHPTLLSLHLQLQPGFSSDYSKFAIHSTFFLTPHTLPSVPTTPFKTAPTKQITFKSHFCKIGGHS